MGLVGFADTLSSLWGEWGLLIHCPFYRVVGFADTLSSLRGEWGLLIRCPVYGVSGVC